VLKLALAHLREGHSRLEQRILPADIDLAGNEEFQQPIDIVFDINKVGNDFFVEIHLTTRIHLICDRCIEAFSSDFKEKYRIILSPNSKFEDADQEDLFFIDEGTKDVDITNSVRQTLLLALPVKRLCKENCKGLCPQCGSNFNKKTCSCRTKTVDPRWEALKKFKKTM
jgi:uncharacterized protein